MPFPLPRPAFAAVVVTNYLHRPILPDLVAAVAPGGALIYETFARGQERFGRPGRTPISSSCPASSSRRSAAHLRVVAYEDLVLYDPAPRAVERIALAAGASAVPMKPITIRSGGRKPQLSYACPAVAAFPKRGGAPFVPCLGAASRASN